VFDATIEVPITIRNPDKPIGTHVFTAMARSDAGLRWTAVTIDNGDDAKDALDRITIPQDVLDRIAPTAQPRSSIIVSDEPLSRETNYRTEFVAVLNNQPQGGFLMRRPTVDVLVARNQPQGSFVMRRPTVNVPVASGNDWGNNGFGFFFQRNWNSQPANTRPRTGQYYQPMQQRPSHSSAASTSLYGRAPAARGSNNVPKGTLPSRPGTATSTQRTPTPSSD
jgi:hypothetical protein